ncbi:MAG: hypothetical protein Q4A78_04385 [Peptostreptococcaceae bacterium]|nr:hypothetical protein [Peptostreptococcaceae bacterium]
MQHLYEKISYLRGLCDGMGVSKESKEGKVLAAVIDTLDEFADAIVELYEEQEEISDYVDAIEDDLTDIEEDFYGDEEGLDFVEMECPSCGAEVEVDEDLLYDDEMDVVCPYCDEVMIYADEEGDEEDEEEIGE